MGAVNVIGSDDTNRLEGLFRSAVSGNRIVPVLKLLDQLPKAPSEQFKVREQIATPSAFAIAAMSGHASEGVRVLAASVAMHALMHQETDLQKIEAIGPGLCGFGPATMPIQLMLVSHLSRAGVDLLKAELTMKGESGTRLDDLMAGAWQSGTYNQTCNSYVTSLIDKGATFSPHDGWCTRNPFHGLALDSSIKGWQNTSTELKALARRITQAGGDINARYPDDVSVGFINPLEAVLLKIGTISVTDQNEATLTGMVAFLIGLGAQVQSGNTLEYVQTHCASSAHLLGPVVTHALIERGLHAAAATPPGAAALDQSPAATPGESAIKVLQRRKISVL